MALRAGVIGEIPQFSAPSGAVRINNFKLVSFTVGSLATAASASASNSAWGLSSADDMVVAAFTDTDLAGGIYAAVIPVDNTIRVRNAGNTSMTSQTVYALVVKTS
jgi:hypothetical protein